MVSWCEHQKRYGEFTRSANVVIESWREDFSCLLERVGLLRLTQADTEKVVKTIRKAESRLASFNEVKDSKGVRDRAQQEIFLCENKVALQELPLDELFDMWT